MKPYGCSCGWSGSTLAGLVAHLGVAHDIYLTLPKSKCVSCSADASTETGRCLRCAYELDEVSPI